MVPSSAGSTDLRLLKRVATLWDDPAWREFFKRYDPLIREWCSAYRLDAASVDELSQRVWVELARRMPSYQYDPGGSFRGWLRRLCNHRAIDLYHERHDRPCRSLEENDLIDSRWIRGGSAGCEPADGEVTPQRLLLQEARDAQEHVRRKVKPQRWEIFWRVMIEGESVSETAAALGLKYATVYAGANHVAHLLRQEGQRRSARLGLKDS